MDRDLLNIRLEHVVIARLVSKAFKESDEALQNLICRDT